MSNREFFRFTNPLDITIGRGRIIWAEALTYEGKHPPYQGEIFPEGWVLPGGVRTQDRALAEAVAKQIDEIAARQGGVR